MWAFMTTGTTNVLKNITDSHPNIDFYFMKKAGSTLVYYEDNRKKGVFVSGRNFEILETYGALDKTGFVHMENIPVMEDGAAVFEDQVKKRLPLLEHTDGLNAARLLKQKKSNQYVILTQWKTEQYYISWQRSDLFKQMDFQNMARLPAYFAERPFTSTYIMMAEE
ncbi:antibiotic biosynthesis monooxygenase [Pseudogracilibacillus sp. SE30717A]|uniref:antibiotic biosynthesis monooxygenase family protein n=1 Tax=Pseudogracilibacillus sp. SE30717A TaxID=3098293 RepID=UPI00300E1D01